MDGMIVADIGGTTSRLARVSSGVRGSAVIVAEHHYASRAYTSIQDVLLAFCRDAAISPGTVKRLVLALPGPVQGDRVDLTNLDWVIDRAGLEGLFEQARVTLINDFQAAACGIVMLDSPDCITINPGRPPVAGLRLVTGAGTGLGLAWLTEDGRVQMSEGGHIDFAPVDEQQEALLRSLRKRYPHVSYERILSGQGLVDAHAFIHGRLHGEATVGVNDAATVSALADRGDDVAAQAVGLFCRIYAQWAGNLALLYRPCAIYLAGGMAPKMRKWLDTEDFRQRYADKGRMRALVERTPLYLVINERLGLLGAIAWAGEKTG